MTQSEGAYRQEGAMLSSFPMNGFVPIKDAGKARTFYEGVLGFELVSDNEFVATYRSGAHS